MGRIAQGIGQGMDVQVEPLLGVAVVLQVPVVGLGQFFHGQGIFTVAEQHPVSQGRPGNALLVLGHQAAHQLASENILVGLDIFPVYLVGPPLPPKGQELVALAAALGKGLTEFFLGKFEIGKGPFIVVFVQGREFASHFGSNLPHPLPAYGKPVADGLEGFSLEPQPQHGQHPGIPLLGMPPQVPAEIGPGKIAGVPQKGSHVAAQKYLKQHVPGNGQVQLIQFFFQFFRFENPFRCQLEKQFSERRCQNGHGQQIHLELPGQLVPIIHQSFS